MMADAALKNCPRCATEKDRSQFGKDRSRGDGLACWCRECLNAHRRKFHLANRESELVKMKNYRAENPPDRQAAVERSRKWANENRERYRANQKNFKHKRRAQTCGKITGEDLRRWEAAQVKVCHWCGAVCAKYEIDHRQPLSKGGEHHLRNLVISCRTCNRKKGARCPVEFAQSMERIA